MPNLENDAITPKFISAMEETTFNYDKIKSLIDQGADINTKNTKGETALMIAAQRKNYLVMGWLLDKGANIYDHSNIYSSNLDKYDQGNFRFLANTYTR